MGLIRQFFPKGTDFNKVTRKEIKHIQDLLDGRRGKPLGHVTNVGHRYNFSRRLFKEFRREYPAS